MLKTTPETPLSEFNLAVFQAVVPLDHYLRKVMACINFEAFRPRLIGSYDPDFGRPAIDPVRMLKILFLRFHYRLSDRQIMERAVTDMAFRWFLTLGVHAGIPNHTNGTHFRHRIGVESFQQVFQDLITQAREHGLVRDRLRLKDATHLFADVAKVGPLSLVAQVRERLLQAAEPLFAEWVSRQRSLFATLRQTTAELPDEERLAQRVEHLRDLATTLQQQLADLLTSLEKDNNPVQLLQRALAVAFKLLADRADPEAGVDVAKHFLAQRCADQMKATPAVEMITAGDIVTHTASAGPLSQISKHGPQKEFSSPELVNQPNPAMSNVAKKVSLERARCDAN